MAEWNYTELVYSCIILYHFLWIARGEALGPQREKCLGWGSVFPPVVIAGDRLWRIGTGGRCWGLCQLREVNVANTLRDWRGDGRIEGSPRSCAKGKRQAWGTWSIGYDLFAAHLQPLALAQSPAWTTQPCFSTDLQCVTTWPGTEKDADAVQVEGARDANLEPLFTASARETCETSISTCKGWFVW